MTARHRFLQWSTPSGCVVLSWPEAMSPEDAAEAVQAVELALRQMRAIADALPRFSDYEAALAAVMEPFP